MKQQNPNNLKNPNSVFQGINSNQTIVEHHLFIQCKNNKNQTQIFQKEPKRKVKYLSAVSSTGWVAWKENSIFDLKFDLCEWYFAMRCELIDDVMPAQRAENEGNKK